ncbi:MAG: triose-phosphate isomerase [Desulfuromonadales bacterium]|nr:triose-phosphate isomerase [Desulfuromonadales bacterium]
MSRVPIIAGNWKLFKTSKEAIELASGLLPLVKNKSNVEIIISPVFTVLERVSKVIAGSNIKLAAQDCFWEEEGAFTGEVSPSMLLDAGCSHVIIGHSERRQYFGETDETVNKKLKAALSKGLTVILCVGETLQEREMGKTFDLLQKQLKGGLSGISSNSFDKIIIAYEPVWAIGTGKTATDQQAEEVHAFIRSEIGSFYSSLVADNIRILYGGSVKPENISGLISQKNIDGALVGGASLQVESFAALVNAV